MSSRHPPASAPDRPRAERANARPRTLGGRYELLEELGRGGMACVYRAIDTSTRAVVALKQLTPPGDPKRARNALALFEREYHLLTQLSHPRVIRVFDFGIDESAPYYTMELLDGGDLRERAPMPWRDACELIFDVCSSLALMHARRLVHRDVSPRNVRCTRDGHAKLIDFGAMGPMGPLAQLVGTAPFVAPEALHGSTLDARTDLFSLGATLYYALTGRLAYPARDFGQLMQVWSEKPAPPSMFRPDIPPALDQLVLATLSLEPALRPRSAFEIMQRLATLAGIRREEPVSVSQAYLVTPQLVGRAEPLGVVHESLEAARKGRGSALLFEAPSGLGRSRMIEACAVEAKMRGAAVLRAQAPEGAEAFAAARSLALDLLAVMPDSAPRAAREAGVYDVLFEPAEEPEQGIPRSDEARRLRSFARPTLELPLVERALRKWIASVSRIRPVVIVADDAERLDEPSIALLARLAENSAERAIVLIASSEQQEDAQPSLGSEALRSRARTVRLLPLTVEETQVLLGSVFGDAPNLALLGLRIHAVTQGNPRAIMAAAQHLIDRGIIRYEDGSFSLPEQLREQDLPASGEDALRVRAQSLSPLALRLARALALSSLASFGRDDFRMLASEASARQVDDALEELLARQILSSDGQDTFEFAHRGAGAVLAAELTEGERKSHHAALADLFDWTARPALATARQRLYAGDYERAFKQLIPILRSSYDRAELSTTSGLSIPEIGRTLDHALTLACELPRPPREQHEIRHWVTLMAVAEDQSYYWRGAPEWLAQIERDSGLSDYRALAHVADPGMRLKMALGSAAKRFAETPAPLRVYAPDEAIRRLIYYVAVSIAIGSRMQDVKLVHSLPALLEPFAPLSPLLHALWQNAVASREVSCLRQVERACQRWSKVYEQLTNATGSDPTLLHQIRYAVAYGVGTNEAMMGLAGATRWAEVLDAEPLQRVNAMYLRKVVRLQQGDLEGAERYRKLAELLALQARMPQMFNSLLTLELTTHYATWDLTGVKQLGEKIAPLAQRNPGWIPLHELAQGHYRRLRGDMEAAREAYEKSLALSTPDADEPTRPIAAWPLASAAYVETLLDLDRAEEARAFAERTLAECERRELGVAAHDLVRAYALAEAKLGEYELAVERLEKLTDAQRALGVTGLSLGATFEARARVAIWAGESENVERFAKLTAEQYRHGHGSTLGARYERLMDEAREAGVSLLAELSPLQAMIFGGTDMSARSGTAITVARTMNGANDLSQRAERALALLCEANASSQGYLFLLRDGALKLVASQAAAKGPDEALRRKVAQFWEELAEDLDLATDIDSDDAVDSACARVRWTDGEGKEYRPLLVSGKVDRVHTNAGVALLAASEASGDIELLMQLASELTPFLVVGPSSDLSV